MKMKMHKIRFASIVKSNTRTSTFRGMPTDGSYENENASDLSRFNFELDSNDIDESDLPHETYDDPRRSTFRRMSSDSRDEWENAPDLIRLNPQWNSNETDRSSHQSSLRENLMDGGIHP
jgi:hypothetical protein